MAARKKVPTKKPKSLKQAALAHEPPVDAAAAFQLLRRGSHVDMPTVLAALAQNPSPELAVAAFEKLSHPDFTSQFPSGRSFQRKWLAELNALATRHPALRTALTEKKKAARTLDAALTATQQGDEVERVAQLRAVWETRPTGTALSKWHRKLSDLHVALFGKWSPYPARAWRDLSPAQRACEELVFETIPNDPTRARDKAEFARRIGRAPAGPAEVELQLEKPRPLWCAVNDVAAQLREPEPVLAAFAALPPGVALGAWAELARGIHSIDVDRAKEWKFAGDFGLRPFNIAFRERFVDLLAQVSLALGRPGEAAALELAAEQDTFEWVERPAVAAAWTLVSHATARGETIDPRWDGLLIKIFRKRGPLENPNIEARVLATLPENRAAPLKALRRPR